MKPSDLRRDAYLWDQLAGSCGRRAAKLADVPDAALALDKASDALVDAVKALTAKADELEARNAS